MASSHQSMSVRRNNHQPRRGVARRRRLPQDRQDEQGHEEGRHDVGRDGALEALHELQLSGGDARILHHGVEPVQPGRPSAEVSHAVEGAEIERPHLDDAARPRGGLDVLLGRLAFLGVAAPEDNLGCAEPGEVPCCLQAQPDVGTSDDDRLVAVVCRRDRQRSVLGPNEVPCKPKGAARAVEKVSLGWAGLRRNSGGAIDWSRQHLQTRQHGDVHLN